VNRSISRSSHSGPVPVLLLAALVAALLFVPSLATAQVGGTWQRQGPAPIKNGQAEAVIPDNEVVGAIHALAPHPTDPFVLYAGAVNGGVWRTSSSLWDNPSWNRLTDSQQSLSIGALEFDPTDAPNYLTLVAGVGRTSSFGGDGGALTGLLRTTDGGATWTAINGGLAGKNISGVAPRGTTLVVSAVCPPGCTFADIGIFRSTNGGTSFTQISGAAGTGLPLGLTYDLASDATDPARLFTAVDFADLAGSTNGVFRSTNTGATWQRVSNAAMEAQIVSGTTSNVEIAVGRHNNVYVAIANNGRLAEVFRSGDGGTTWTALGVPGDADGGIHPGSQGSIHLSIVADPTDANIVYIGGDRQPLRNEPTGGNTFPNLVGATNFTGRLYRGDASQPAASRWTPLTHSGTASGSAPHADSREMVFDAWGYLLEADDGGTYIRTNPRDATGDWWSNNGDLHTTEAHDSAWDGVSEVILTGNQDVGSSDQDTRDFTDWTTVNQGDGGDVAVDDFGTPGMSVRYSSAQQLQGFVRRVFDANNVQQGMDVFPALAPLGMDRQICIGVPGCSQFVTPVVLNTVNSQRLILADLFSVFESTDQGQMTREIRTNLQVNGGGSGAIAYGAAGNQGALYVGGGPPQAAPAPPIVDRVYVRTADFPTPVNEALAYPGRGSGRRVQALVIDPANGGTAFAVDTARVYRTTNFGAAWNEVTGNLASFNPGTLRSAVFIDNPSGDALAVGADRGAFIAFASGGWTTWQRLGHKLPNAPVFDLDYDANGGPGGNDLLVAGTLGRGTWKLSPVTQPEPPGHRLLLLLDRTGSMNTPPADPRCDRSEVLAAATLTQYFIDHPDGRVAVWTFYGDAAFRRTGDGFVDQQAANAFLAEIAQEGCQLGTPMAEAICEGTTFLRDPDIPTGSTLEMVISTDGEENNSSGPCAGPPTSMALTPPFDAGSWHNLVWTAVTDPALASVKVHTVLWVPAVNPIPALTPAEPGAVARRGNKAVLTDEAFFRFLTGATGGAFRLIVDGEPPPPGVFDNPDLLGTFHGQGGDVAEIDPETGASSVLVGPSGVIRLGLDGVTAAASSADGSLLYLATGDSTDSLYRVDLGTGAITLVGPMTGGATNIQAMDLAPAVAASHGFTPGWLYGISMDGLGGCNPNCFFKIDKATGAATPIRGLQLNQGRGMSFHPGTGELWVYDSGGKRLYTVDGAGNLSFKMQVPHSNFQQQTGVDTAFSLAHDCNGALFTVDVAYGVLVEIDILHQQAHWVGARGSVHSSGGTWDLQALDGSGLCP